MCIAIANLQSQPLSQEQIENCWSNNGDGAGILYKEGGRLKIYKNLKSVKKFYKKYTKVIEQSNCLIHFRISTAGGVNTKNCHPFFVDKDLGFIHNGVISGWGNKVDGQSDTYSYNKEVLGKLPKGFQKNDAICELIGSDIGTGSKFAFMDKTGEFTIIGANRYRAHYGENGNWYSNDSYKEVKNFVYAGNKKVMKNTTNTKLTKLSDVIEPTGPRAYKKAWDHTIAREIEVKVFEKPADAPLYLKGQLSYSLDFCGYIMTSILTRGLKPTVKSKPPIEFKQEDIDDLDNDYYQMSQTDLDYLEYINDQMLEINEDVNNEDVEFLREISEVFDKIPTAKFTDSAIAGNFMVLMQLHGTYYPRYITAQQACAEIRIRYNRTGTWSDMCDLMKMNGGI